MNAQTEIRKRIEALEMLEDGLPNDHRHGVIQGLREAFSIIEKARGGRHEYNNNQ